MARIPLVGDATACLSEQSGRYQMTVPPRTVEPDRIRTIDLRMEVSPPGFRGGRLEWFPLFIERVFGGPYRVACCCSYSAGGMSPSEVCRRSLLNQATYSTIASSSWLRLRQTRSRISSVLKLSTKLSAIALS